MKYSIVIPTIGKYRDFLLPCVESVLRNSIDFEMIIVNNGLWRLNGIHEVLELQIDHPQIVFCSYSYNLGAANALNTGIKLARGEHIVLLNDDTLIQGKNWLSLLEEPFLSDPTVVATGPLKLFSQETQMEFILFFCVMISKAASDVYPISTEFGAGYGEDMDWCARVQKDGLKIVQVSQCSPKDGTNVGGFPIYHAGGVSVHGLKDWKDIMERNTQLLKQKYGQ